MNMDEWLLKSKGLDNCNSMYFYTIHCLIPKKHWERRIWFLTRQCQKSCLMPFPSPSRNTHWLLGSAIFRLCHPPSFSVAVCYPLVPLLVVFYFFSSGSHPICFSSSRLRRIWFPFSLPLILLWSCCNLCLFCFCCSCQCCGWNLFSYDLGGFVSICF